MPAWLRRRRRPSVEMPPEPGRPSPPAALELRVHGVSGTPPEDLLDRPLVHQIAGDAIAGFFVPRLDAERHDDAPTPCSPTRPNPAELAGYSWGGLTSGSPARALWLLLLPFTLLNVAPRARPAGIGAESGRTRAIWYLCRLLALTLTVLLAMVGVGIGEDLIGWQCVGSRSCSKAAPSWVFSHLSLEHHWGPERMLLLGALLPTALFGLVWWSSARTANRYERKVARVRGALGDDDVNADPDVNRVEIGLDSQLMWRNADQVRRLRAIHMQSAFAVVLASVSAVTRWRWLAYPMFAVIGFAAVVLLVPRFTGHGRWARWRVTSYAIWGVLGGAAVVQVCGLGLGDHWIDSRFLATTTGEVTYDLPEGRTITWTMAYRHVPQDGLPYYAEAVLWVCVVALVALILLIGVTAMAAVAPPPPAPAPYAAQPPGLKGLATAIFAALGVFLAATFGAGAYVFAAAWLNSGSLKPGFRDVALVHTHFTVPAAVASASIAFTFAAAGLLVSLVIWGIVVGVRVKGTSAYATELAADYPTVDDAHRAKAIRRAMLFGALVDEAPVVLVPLVGSGLIIVIAFAAVLVRSGGHAPVTVLGHAHGWVSAASLGGTGAYLAVLTLLGIVSLGALAYRTESTRKSVGILWDVASFWPRASHPLAAPCYAERTVPDLVTFITDRRSPPHERTLVLSAHSQGTVITAAVIRQLRTFDTAAGLTGPESVVGRLGFLTFGCVLRRLYGRFFPVYFGPDQLAELHLALTCPRDGETPQQRLLRTPRWRNLWRYTDYLGGQVTAGPPQVVPSPPAPVIDPDVLIMSPPVVGPVGWEWHSADPPFFPRRPDDTTFAPPSRHSDFWKDRSGYFQLAVADLIATTDG